MSRREYRRSIALAIVAGNEPFYTLLMACMRQADTANLERLRAAFPQTWAEFIARNNAPNGRLPEDEE